MKINPVLRDWWPKRGLNGQYIGDRYPLCVDLPDRPFLRKGAKYRLENADWIKWKKHHKRVVLDPSTSNLHKKLCKSKLNGGCEYPSIVILDENLECNNFDSLECQVHTVNTVQVAPGIFYSYEQVPCVQLTVYHDAKKIIAGHDEMSPLKACGKILLSILMICLWLEINY